MSKLRERIEEHKRQGRLPGGSLEDTATFNDQPSSEKVQDQENRGSNEPASSATISQKESSGEAKLVSPNDPLEQIAQDRMPASLGTVKPSTEAKNYTDLISFEEVCRQLNINWSWLKLWTMTRLITPVRSREHANRFMISVAELNKLLENSTFGPKRVAVK